ncbi:MAG: chorismate synthase, partial [Actinobacteria bacterium]|nr:chorismate synthase [Actinomycetota bacterium]
ARRRLGYGRGPRMRFEQDRLEIIGGVRHGFSLGSPIALVIHNSEWNKWERVMSPEEGPAGNVLTEPRPGHADLSGMLKYDREDARDILERASARETAARTAAGAIAKTLLNELAIAIVSHVVAIGDVEAASGPVPLPADIETIDASPVRCFDPSAETKMIAAIEAAGSDGDSLGGIIEVIAYDLPPGLGSHVHWDRRLDAEVARAMMSIPAIKAVEIGDGFAVAKLRGSVAHDEIFFEDGRFIRHTDRAGGTEGGMSIGGTLRVRAAMKPLSTLKRPLRTVDVNTKEQVSAFKERTDVCAVPAAAVVGEAVIALAIAGSIIEKFGGDSLGDLKGSYERYMHRVAER